MNPEEFSEWLTPLSVSERIAALVKVYSRLTVVSRELFMPDRTAGKEHRVLEILHGLNEIHHTLANSLGAYTTDECKAFSVDILSAQLWEIAKQYRIESFLESAVDRLRSSRA